jgi:hypothetical protein
VDARITRNKQYLADLFAGPFHGHAIIVDPEPLPAEWPGDYACGSRPVRDWVPRALKQYEAQVQRLEALDDDSVPVVNLRTGTYILAATFGCPIHLYDDSPAAARPLVSTAEEADRLPEPDVYAPPLGRVFEFAELLQARLGPDVPLSVPDIQSPFDVAALIWNKQDLYVALYENPAAVLRLVDKCERLLTAFLHEFRRRLPQASYCHCPNAWAPAELGCWLSEDEAGSMSTPMFEAFCLPSLVRMSEAFGGMFVHCCATADHQYRSLGQIPNLRGLNRVFQAPGPRPAIEAFAGRTVLMVAWNKEDQVNETLDMARPESRFLFNIPGKPLEEARGIYERLRARCPRNSGGSR